MTTTPLGVASILDCSARAQAGGTVQLSGTDRLREREMRQHLGMNFAKFSYSLPVN
jgi:hypothetical protein